MTSDEPIQHVTDTAFWVATYRAVETERKDALFQDPMAGVLVEGRGRAIAAQMPHSDLAGWSVVIRTLLIDDYIQSAIAQGVDTVLNLGAGLDTRPYRLEFPPSFKWIEIDFPQTIEFKEQRLKNEKPHCQLERIQLDLSDGSTRKKIFSEINSRCQKVLVISEGVVPYLSTEEAGTLATDLHLQPHFKLWVTDYLAPQLMKSFLKDKLKNAPFRFFPENWETFFKTRGWSIKQMRYLHEEAKRFNRPAPLTWYKKLLFTLFTPSKKKSLRGMIGFALLDRA